MADGVDREIALTALRAVLEQLTTGGDPQAVLGEESADLAAAVTENAFPNLHEDHPARYLLGFWHLARHQALGAEASRSELDSAAELLEPIAMVTPELVPPDLLRLYAQRDPDHVSTQADLLTKIYQYNGDRHQVHRAITLFRTVLDTAGAAHPKRTTHLSNLGAALLLGFGHGGGTDTLDEAIQLFRSATAGNSDDPLRPMHLSNLGAALRSKYEAGGGPDALEEAIRTLRAAVDNSSPHDRHRTMRQLNLGNALRASFSRTGDLASLIEAVRLLREAVANNSEDDLNHQNYLSSLGGALLTSFENSGDIAVLDEAISVLYQAVSESPAGAPEHVVYLSNLGNALGRRFRISGDVAAIQESVRVLRQAVDATRTGSPHTASYWGNLGVALRLKFERAHDEADLAESIQCFRESVRNLSAESPNRFAMLGNLSHALLLDFGLTGHRRTLDESVELAGQAAELVADGAQDRGQTLSTLADALESEFEISHDEGAFEAALRAREQAVSASASSPQGHGFHQFELGRALWQKFTRTGDLAAREGARQAFSATVNSAAPADMRVLAARVAIDLDLLADDADHALTLAERATELLILVAPARLRRSDRQYRIAGLAGLPSSVATAAISAGQVDRAVELLEQTRGILLTETLDVRGGLGILRDRAPELAAEFVALRDALANLDQIASTPEFDLGAPVESTESSARARMFDEWEGLLRRVRAVPGRAEFLLPPPVDTLRSAAMYGPIVYIVIHDHASHAVVLSNSAARPAVAIPLPGLNRELAFAAANELRTAQHLAYHGSTVEQQRAQVDLLRMLGWLWDTVTQPVLDHLGYRSVPTKDEQWPRVYWCPVEVATFFPLQAAGRHTRSDQTGRDPAAAEPNDSVMDRVVSSYTPTARTLRHTLAKTGIDVQPGRTVIVAVPDAPDTHKLDKVPEEVANIRAVIPASADLSTPGRPTTRATVLTALPHYEIAHFACHGLADWTNPASSRLILHDYQTHPLTVTAIAGLHLGRGQLAFLSACSTTDTDPQHADEAVHITAAFQIAGYRSVVGTLWPISDQAAAKIAQGFYSGITAGGTAPPRPELAALALHHTIRRHRDAYPLLPMRWAAYIHTGH